MIKVDVTKASLTHTMKKLKYFKGFFLLLHFLSGFPWKTSAPTQPGQFRIVLLARNLKVWAKQGCRTSLTHKKKDPGTKTKAYYMIKFWLCAVILPILRGCDVSRMYDVLSKGQFVFCKKKCCAWSCQSLFVRNRIIVVFKWNGRPRQEIMFAPIK